MGRNIEPKIAKNYCWMLIKITYLNSIGASVAFWVASGFVAFPSGYNSTVCSPFHNFTKVGYSRRKPSAHGKQSSHSERWDGLLPTPSIKRGAVLQSLRVRSFLHRSSVADHVLCPAFHLFQLPPSPWQPTRPCVRLLCRDVTERNSTILASAGVDGNVWARLSQIGSATSGNGVGVSDRIISIATPTFYVRTFAG